MMTGRLHYPRRDHSLERTPLLEGEFVEQRVSCWSGLVMCRLVEIEPRKSVWVQPDIALVWRKAAQRKKVREKSIVVEFKE